ncbi:hypothetical protein [Borrelia sp. RT1S]|nr:hypothetical protein [Borrelia sp. RT1S]UGQ17832.1 hypothetical protein LSO05_05220 [Borrelia sp. RT1S]
MAILGSDIPAVDIARVSEKNLVKRLKRKFMPSDSYLNEGVFLNQDRVNIIFHSRLKKFLKLGEDIKTEGGFMSKENREGEQAEQNAEQIENQYCAQIAERIGDKIGEALTSIIESIKDKVTGTEDASENKNIDVASLAYLEKLTNRIETFNQNFARLSHRESKRDIVTNYITSYKDLIAKIKLHQNQNGFVSFTEAEDDFTSKNKDRIRIENKVEEIEENV